MRKIDRRGLPSLSLAIVSTFGAHNKKPLYSKQGFSCHLLAATDINQGYVSVCPR
jgi:hypothetical protein